MTLLALDQLTVMRGGSAAVASASLAVGPGEVVGLIGPNGAGKTTLLRAALGLLPVAAGRSSLAALPAAARARAVAFLPQGRTIAWPVTVADLVALGRLPHGGGPGRLAAGDRAAVGRALAATGLAGLAGRIATELSGGEQARALMARALAQEAPLLLADEPVAGLDPAAQLAALATFGGLARAGRAVVVTLHDLGLAARACTRLVMMQAGRIVADGTAAEVLTDARLAAVFGIRAFRATTAAGPIVQPLEVV
ncbi:MAG: ABC transporter ATP-binding protein [Rhodobacteraceae bacterium]|jgi:iron complex transport system ATP-binding protein|nr:ABC transporter ATP-binding protein [Paracoccaceae bacterium]